MLKSGLYICALAVSVHAAGAQDSTALGATGTKPWVPMASAPARSAPARSAPTTPSLVTRRDLWPTGLAVVATSLTVQVDRAVARRLQRSDLQGSRPLFETARAVQFAGDPGALIASVALYGFGQLGHRPGLADAGLHATEAIMTSGIITQSLKQLVGRARPWVVNDSDALSFRVGRGSQTGYNAMPSGHTTAAFAAASVFSRELRLSHPHTAKWASPLLYTTAGMVGASRMYNNKHWTSDVVMGAAIGTMVGNRLVTYTHQTPNSRWNWTLSVR